MSHTTLIAYLVHPKGPGVERSMLFPLIIEVPFTESGKKRPCDFKKEFQNIKLFTHYTDEWQRVT